MYLFYVIGYKSKTNLSTSIISLYSFSGKQIGAGVEISFSFLMSFLLGKSENGVGNQIPAGSTFEVFFCQKNDPVVRGLA